MNLITTTDSLAAFCASLKGAPYVTIDTEFMRERSYYSKLCLVQLASETKAVAIDPLADGIDLSPLYALLSDPTILKVFHAARQDIEIFVQATGRVPSPLFDTQVAAMVCGYGDSISYENLVISLAGATVDKSSRFTDWSHRPLSEKQITYALGDVTYLRVIYEKLAKKLEQTGRTDWVSEEMAVLTDLSTYQVDPYSVWKRLKLRSDKPRRRAILREIAAWREMEAQKNNLPRSRILKDEQLVDIATHAPGNVEELGKLRGLPSGFAEGRHGTAILEAITRANAIPLKECPEGEVRRTPKAGTGAILELLKVLLRQVSDQHGVAAKLIATSDDLEDIANGKETGVKTLSGWRRQIFGDTALALQRGEIALTVRKGRVVTIDHQGQKV